jgi:DNA-binding NarL/FixJ family response regulator
MQQKFANFLDLQKNPLTILSLSHMVFISNSTAAFAGIINDKRNKKAQCVVVAIICHTGTTTTALARRRQVSNLLNGFKTIFLQVQLEIVARACDGAEAIKLVAQHSPDVAILDVNMPNLIEATKQISQLFPDVGIPLYRTQCHPQNYWQAV